MPTDSLIPLILFMAFVLAASLHGLAASGHFPRGGKASIMETLLLFGTMALVAACAVGGTARALNLIPWYAAVIGGGLSILAAPLVLQWFPDRFVDGSGALAVFAGLSTGLAMLLIALAAARSAG